LEKPPKSMENNKYIKINGRNFVKIFIILMLNINDNIKTIKDVKSLKLRRDVLKNRSETKTVLASNLDDLIAKLENFIIMSGY